MFWMEAMPICNYYYYRESKCCFDSNKPISSPTSSCPNDDHMMPVFPQPHHDYKLDEVCESCIRIFQLIGGWTVNSWFYNKLALCIIWSGQIIHFLFSRVQSRLATNTTMCHCYLLDIQTRLHLLLASQWPLFYQLHSSA